MKQRWNKARINDLFIDHNGGNDIGLQSAVVRGDSLLRYLYGNIDASVMQKGFVTRFYEGSSLLNLHTSLYDELLNTGKLYTLGSDSLTSAVKNYYRFLDRESRYHESNLEAVSKGLELLDDNYY